MASIGTVSATITANGQQFINEFNRADNAARRASASIATSASKMSSAFARGGLKAFGLAEVGGLIKNELREILTDFEEIKGISPEAKDSIFAFSETLTELRQNVRGFAAEALAAFADFGSNIGYLAGELVYGKEAADAAREEGAISAQRGRAAAAAEKTAKEVKKLTEEMREAERAAGKSMGALTGSLLEPAEQAEALNARLGSIMMTLTEMDTSTPEGVKERTKALKDMESTARSLEKVNKQINDDLKEQARLAREIGGELAGSFENAVFSGGKLRDMLKGILDDMLRLLFREAITKPLAGAIAGALGGSIFGGLFGGPKAAGGPVSGGSTYLVGEEGPELFRAGSSGTIIPNDRLVGSGAGGTVNHYNIDARGATTDAVRELRAIMSALNASIEPRSVAAVRDADKRRK